MNGIKPIFVQLTANPLVRNLSGKQGIDPQPDKVAADGAILFKG